MSDLRIRILPAIADIPAQDWDACANPVGASCGAGGGETARATPYNPFISHAFLSALEASGSATARVGWQPQHLVAERDDGRVAGVVPCYLKSHSRGEYVFDAGWADAYERAGGSYYPKLQVSVPFTPATGRRLLVAPGPEADAIRARARGGPVELARAARGVLRARDVRAAGRMDPARRARLSSSAPTSNSIGKTPATRPSMIS